MVRSVLPLEFERVQIPADIPCEIQIRTLLQHAYSELTHDTIYKPNVRATPAVKRTAAKSMALIEATSDYFSSVNQVIQQVLADTKRIGTFLLSKYSAVTNTVAVESPLNSLLIDHYKSQIGASFETDFESWWMGKGFLGELITVRRDVAALYRTPSISSGLFLRIYSAQACETRQSVD